jgi:hypothetical protein
MPLPDATFELAAQDSALKLLMQDYLKKAFASESFDFYFSKESNQIIYNKYVKQEAEHEVNIPSGDRIPLDKLALAAKWDQMAAPLKKARATIAELTRKDVLRRFAVTPEYKRWAAAKYKTSSEDGVKATGLLAKELKSAKDLATLKALMLMVEGGRTPADRKQAYVAIENLVKAKAKVPVIFKATDLVVPK